MMGATTVHHRLAFLGIAILSFPAVACSSDGAGTGASVPPVGHAGGDFLGTGGSGAAGTEVASGGTLIGTGGIVASGGAPSAGGGGAPSSNGGTPSATGGAAPSSGGAQATGGASAGGAAGTGGVSTTRCDDPTLVWKTANKTHYTSYPDPGSAECIQYNGCTWAGLFAACNDKKPESWVASHDIVALFPLDPYSDHDLCLRAGTKRIVVTAIDTCGDSDCNGCCTQNKGSADALVDIESYTDARWGVPDGPIEWADLGLNPAACN